MPGKEEKKGRKALVDQLAGEAQARVEAAMPIAKPDLKALFDYLDVGLQVEGGCDGTLTLTRAFLAERGLPQEAVLDWLMSYGGGCDCEVLGSVEEAWSEEAGGLHWRG